MKNKKGQAIVEYIAMFAIVIAGLLLVFGGLTSNVNLLRMFNDGTTRAINAIANAN